MLCVTTTFLADANDALIKHENCHLFVWKKKNKLDQTCQSK